jgi:hypothetical protein
MKIIVLFAWSICACTSGIAQSTTQFGIALDAGHALPSNNSSIIGAGSFSVDSQDVLNGVVDVYWGDRTITAVGLFQSSLATALGQPKAQFSFQISVAPWVPQNGPAFPGADQYRISVPLTSSDLQELRAGNWWVNVSTANYPNGEIRGQIIAVPEPSTVALALIGVGGVLFRCRSIKAALDN